ncbi:NAD-dependent epimerase/dehydratase family protein [Rubritalea spongiae]|uniref:NAD-dependent epimerase/dehydratase family protein n=2 Tax=Rubritalea spongiae TaxID=430797 RepID=A0ABW5E5Y7_9BACT
MKHVLLVGNGFVGKCAAEMFRMNGWRVTTVNRTGMADEHADVGSENSLQKLKNRIEKPTHVVHCASASGGGVETYQQVYLDGCCNLAELFPSIPILFTSSTSVYPQTDGTCVDENSLTVLDRETGKILLEAEAAILKSNGIVARLAGIYGNGRSYLLKKFLSGEASMEEGGERILNHIHQWDAASAIVHLLDRADARGEIYNVCDSSPKSQIETYRELARIFEKPLPPSASRKLNSKRGWSHKAVSNAKLVSTGWRPKYESFTEAAAEVSLTL